MKKILEVKGLRKYFTVKKGPFGNKSFVKAVNGVNLSINEGETFSLVGESGCGKSTTGRLIGNLIKPTAGTVTFDGVDLYKLSANKMRRTRKDIQFIFQDPYASLNPKKTVYHLLMDPLIIHGISSRAERDRKVVKMAELVGLSKTQLKRYPHEFSGGQRQRIGIARALILRPKLVIADEPVSALDVSIQAQILNLLKDLQDEFQLTYLFISHDLSVVKHMSDHIAVMYLGKIVETSSKDELFKNTKHPYTKALLSSIPMPDPELKNREKMILKGELPDTMNLPGGCLFHTRCPFRRSKCMTEVPKQTTVDDAHNFYCHYPLQSE